VERQWAKSVQTRRALLDAARDVFLEMGFAGASVTGIVERSGVSVGSIYHHFGGKAELFVALWETFEGANKAAARDAVAAARDAGESDPVELLVAGTRAYLETTWLNRREAGLYLGGDAPPGFETLQRKDTREWVRKNAALLGGDDEPFRRVQVMALTSIVGDAAAEVSSLRTRREATKMIEATLAIVRKVAA
jgi:AcrR family transcriptional regulator